MIDKADKETQKRLKDIEDRLKKVYAQSEKDITQAWNRYMLEQNAYVKDLQEAYATAKQYGTAEEAREIGRQLGQAKAERTLQNQYYKDMVAETTKKLATVNETALRYVNDQMPNIYSINYNDAAVDCDRLGFRFDLVDEGTVKRLVTDGDIKLPNKALNIPKDMRWNTKQLNSSVLQGIVNGESMDKIAKRILPVVNNNAAAAIRNARTMVNGAENLGRLDSLKQMKNLGIVVEKVWMATHDERTRASHAYLDGEGVAPEEAFPNGLICPGDPDGPPEEVYNCRCKLIREVKGFISPTTGEFKEVNIHNYEPDYFDKEEIEKERQEKEQRRQEKQAAQKEPLPEFSKLKSAMEDDKYQEYRALIDNNEYVRETYRLYADDVRAVNKLPNSGKYQPALKTVNYSYDKTADVSIYSTLAHEYGHAFDDIARDGFVGLTHNEIETINNALNIGTFGVLKKMPSSSDQYLTALKADRAFLATELKKAEVIAEIKSTSASGSVQDLADGFFSTQSGRDKSTIGVFFSWGHGDKYYNRMYNQRIKEWSKEKEFKEALISLGYDASNQTKAKRIARNYEAASELWANQVSALTVGGKELEFMEKYTPNTMSVIKGLLKGVTK